MPRASASIKSCPTTRAPISSRQRSRRLSTCAARMQDLRAARVSPEIEFLNAQRPLFAPRRERKPSGPLFQETGLQVWKIARDVERQILAISVWSRVITSQHPADDHNSKFWAITLT